MVLKKTHTSNIKHWKMVKAVTIAACTAKMTSLIWTGFTPPGWSLKYSCWQGRVGGGEEVRGECGGREGVGCEEGDVEGEGG